MAIKIIKKAGQVIMGDIVKKLNKLKMLEILEYSQIDGGKLYDIEVNIADDNDSIDLSWLDKVVKNISIKVAKGLSGIDLVLPDCVGEVEVEAVEVEFNRLVIRGCKVPKLRIPRSVIGSELSICYGYGSLKGVKPALVCQIGEVEFRGTRVKLLHSSYPIGVLVTKCKGVIKDVYINRHKEKYKNVGILAVLDSNITVTGGVYTINCDKDIEEYSDLKDSVVTRNFKILKNRGLRLKMKYLGNDVYDINYRYEYKEREGSSGGSFMETWISKESRIDLHNKNKENMVDIEYSNSVSGLDLICSIMYVEKMFRGEYISNRIEELLNYNVLKINMRYVSDIDGKGNIITHSYDGSPYKVVEKKYNIKEILTKLIELHGNSDVAVTEIEVHYGIKGDNGYDREVVETYIRDKNTGDIKHKSLIIE